MDYKTEHINFVQLLMTSVGITDIELAPDDPDLQYDIQTAQTKIMRRFEEIKDGGSTAEKGNFNHEPLGLEVIDMEMWMHMFFHYQKRKPELRQVFGTPAYGSYDLIMMDIPNFNNDKLGIGIMRVYHENGLRLTEPKYLFTRYGTADQWLNFERRFAAQFAGDNS